MISVEKLKDYAMKLEFEMEEKEYETLQNEFEILLKQIDLISKIDNIENTEVMSFPFKLTSASLREDEVTERLSKEEAFSNAKKVKDDSIKVPRVVGE